MRLPQRGYSRVLPSSATRSATNPEGPAGQRFRLCLASQGLRGGRMPRLRYRLFHPTLFALCAAAACATAQQLPRLRPAAADYAGYYPPASRRLGDQGRVLVEFHLDADRKVQDVAIPQWDLHNAKPFYEEGITKRL